MTEHARPHQNEVDFVVGSSADTPGDEVLDAGTGGHPDRRLLVGLIVAAMLLVGVVVALRSNDPTNTSAAPSGSPSTPLTAPARPSFGAPTPGTTIKFTTVNLGPKLCAPHRDCFGVPTSKAVQAKIRSAIRQTFGGVSRLRIRNSVIAIDDPPRESLFARRITASTPHGAVQVVAAAVAGDSILTVPVAGNAIATQGSVAGYVVAGSIKTSRGTDPLLFSERLRSLVGDARLVAKF